MAQGPAPSIAGKHCASERTTTIPLALALARQRRKSKAAPSARQGTGLSYMIESPRMYAYQGEQVLRLGSKGGAFIKEGRWCLRCGGSQCAQAYASAGGHADEAR